MTIESDIGRLRRLRGRYLSIIDSHGAGSHKATMARERWKAEAGRVKEYYYNKAAEYYPRSILTYEPTIGPRYGKKGK